MSQSVVALDPQYLKVTRRREVIMRPARSADLVVVDVMAVVVAVVVDVVAVMGDVVAVVGDVVAVMGDGVKVVGGVDLAGVTGDMGTDWVDTVDWDMGLADGDMGLADGDTV